MKVSVKDFVHEVNSQLYPVLQIVHNVDRPYPNFELCLCKTEYAMMDKVVAEDSFTDLIKDTAKHYFNSQPNFNNTRRVFWFIQ